LISIARVSARDALGRPDQFGPLSLLPLGQRSAGAAVVGAPLLELFSTLTLRDRPRLVVAGAQGGALAALLCPRVLDDASMAGVGRVFPLLAKAGL
jgi:hypothetical protein